jgi:hypothetical protein
MIREGEEEGRWGSTEEEKKVDKIDTICSINITETYVYERKT